MNIGVPKEIKNHEYRVGMTPSGVRELVLHGHSVWVEKGAGLGIGIEDAQYQAVGAHIADTAAQVFEKAELIVKVKEPQAEEWKRLKAHHTLFTYLHLAPNRPQVEGLLASGCVAIAYETVTDAQGGLPLLTPMSEVAGRLSVQVGAHCLEKMQGGRGILLGGVPGVLPAQVLVLGGGVVGTQAIQMALGLGADVVVLDKSLPRLQTLDQWFGGRLKTLYSTRDVIEQQVMQADLIVGAVLVTGAITPQLVSRAMLKSMQPGTVLVDVAIDQGGCFESSRPTTFDDPSYIEERVVHYCVANMPGGVPRTSTFALANATLPFILQLADKGTKQACVDNQHLRQGVNICQGKISHRAVAEAMGQECVPCVECF